MDFAMKEGAGGLAIKKYLEICAIKGGRGWSD